MSNILSLFHTGSGSTKTVATLLETKLKEFHNIEMQRVHQDFDYKKLPDYDFILIGFPTYFWTPSKFITEFVEKMPVYEHPVKAFVYTTCGIYNGNSLRILVKKLFNKNIIAVAHETIKGPASDYILFPVSASLMFEYENGLSEKIDRSARKINEQISNDKISYNVPAFKLYVPLNNLLKWPGKKWFYYYRDRLHNLEDRCTNCNLCVNNCRNNCWSEGENHPYYKSENCEFCLGCVHNCPEKAVIFSEGMTNKTRFNKKFYSKFLKK
ncbi:MAG: EFR1 family ferrodoxin [Desulfamplus sp.]|nr:EFR1 family ferrodoxin [Desulfamplus sp.]